MSALASTSRVQLRIIKEATFGVTPVTGNPRNLRMTGESLDFTLTKEQSKEIRSDRQISSATTVDAAAAGNINIEQQYGEYDDLVEACAMGTWTPYGTAGAGAPITANFTTGAVTASAPTTGAEDLSLLQLGQWFRLNAPGSANDRKFFKVSSTVAPTSTVVTLDSSTPALAETAVANASVQASRLSNGVLQRSFTLEKQLADVGQFFAYRGMNVSKMSLSFASAALATGSFDFMGKDGVRSPTTTLPGAPIASQPFDIMNGVRGMGQLWEGGAPLASTFVKSMTLNWDNTLRQQKALAHLGSIGVGVGDVAVSGTAEVYFADGVMYDKFLNDVYTSLSVGIQDSAGNGYVYTLPRVLLMTGKVQAGSKNNDLMVSFDYMAFSDDGNPNPALRKTIFVDRFGAALT